MNRPSLMLFAAVVGMLCFDHAAQAVVDNGDSLFAHGANERPPSIAFGPANAASVAQEPDADDVQATGVLNGDPR